jgi:hypothetical protein
MSENKYNPSYKIYKPNFKDSTKGASSSWEWNPKTGNFFLTIAKQSGEKSDGGKPTFSWKDNSETFKMAESDLAEVALVLSGEKSFLGFEDGSKGKGLFHQNKSGNSILKMYRLDKGLGMELSSKKGDVRFWTGHRISEGEAKFLSTIIERCMWEMFNHSSD